MTTVTFATAVTAEVRDHPDRIPDMAAFFTVVFLCFFAGMGFFFVAGEAWMPTAPAVILGGGLIILSVVIPILYLRRVRNGNVRVKTIPGARRGTGRILEAHELPVSIMAGGSTYPDRVYRLRVRVEGVGARPYEVKHFVSARPWEVDHLRPGQSAPVYVHPGRPGTIHLAFDEAAGAAGSPDGGEAGGADYAALASDPALAEQFRTLTGLDLAEVLKDAVPGQPIQVTQTHIVQEGEGEAGDFPDGRPVLDARAPGDIRVGAPRSGGDLEVTVTNTRLDLMRTGRPGTAVVNAARDLGLRTPTGRVVELELRVTVGPEEPYRVVVRADLSPSAIPRVGETIKVRVDSENPGRVLVEGEGDAPS